jgi:antirestriction protein ArdC
VKAGDVYASVTAAIVEQLERGDALGQWSAPWHGRHGVPRNAATGDAYKGGNVLAFWGAQIKHGYRDPWWATYRQWAALGRQVERGQRATYGIKWVDRSRGDASDGREPGEIRLRDLERRAFPVGFAVFNVAQTQPAEVFEGIPWEPPTARTGPDPIPRCAVFFERIGARIIVGPPAYSPATDTILLPPLDAFDDAQSHYATAAHEHAHWTGHRSRLARDLKGKFGSESYAAEELVAELAAAYIAAALGIETQPRADHAQYLASWLRVLRADSRALYRAATLAQAASDYLTERGNVSACAA